MTRQRLRLAGAILAVALALGGATADRLSAEPRQAPGAVAAPAIDPALAFEVASVKKNLSGDQRVMFGGAPGTPRFTATNTPLFLILVNAFRLQRYQIVGGPPWMDSDRFDIVAKPPAGANTPFHLQTMLRNLLADRFKLTTHTETRDMPIYALVVAKKDGTLGPKMKASTTDCTAVYAARARGAAAAGPPVPSGPNDPIPCGMMMNPFNIRAGATPMANFVNALAQQVGRAVVDKTGLAGAYDFELTYTREQIPNLPPDVPVPVADPNSPSLFTALQEQLGLKLEAQRGPVEVLVIDSVQQPTED